MSGGAFDYKDNILFDLKDMIAREIGLLKYGGNNEDWRSNNHKVIEYMKVICKDLGRLGNILHSLDWYLSGDTSEEKFITDFENVYKENK